MYSMADYSTDKFQHFDVYNQDYYYSGQIRLVAFLTHNYYS